MVDAEKPLEALAAAAADWLSRPLSADVAWATRRAILDWFAATLPGCIMPPARLLAPAMAGSYGTGRAVSYVDGRMGAARHVALINATASHSAEFDDIFKDGGYHPGSPTIAAALAVAQDRQLPLQTLHQAVVAGFEVGCRLSLAIQPSHYRYWHTTATVGTMGAAVAGAVALGCDAHRIGHAIAIATSFAGGHQQNLQGEGMVKALHSGHAADAGLLAAYAAHAGITGSARSLDAEIGYAAATSESTGDWEAALEGLGEWTPIMRTTIKNHGCCGHIFPALDGVRNLQIKTQFKPDSIRSIHVDGYGPTYQLCNRPDPTTPQDARFSLQHCIAAQLILGGVRLSAFAPDALRNPAIRALMPKITVSQDAELAAGYPRRRMARIRITLADGQIFEHLQQHRKGDPEDPLADDELIAKYDELAETVLARATADELRETILYGNDLPGATPLSLKAIGS